jgi:hypothetical protein
MDPLIQLNRQLQYSFIAVLLACLATPAMAQRDNTPNHKEIILTSITSVPCAGENVDIRGEVKLKFGHGDFFGTRQFGPVNRDLAKGFSGNCPNSGECQIGIGQTTRRKFMANTRIGITEVNTEDLNGLGVGTCKLFLVVTGVPNPPPQADAAPGREVHFKLLYTVSYKFHNNKVTLFKATRSIRCN